MEGTTRGVVDPYTIKVVVGFRFRGYKFRTCRNSHFHFRFPQFAGSTVIKIPSPWYVFKPPYMPRSTIIRDIRISLKKSRKSEGMERV